MSEKKIRVAIIGLGFGAEFIPIYQRHPNAEMYAICRRDKKELDAVGDRFGIAKRYTSYDELLKDPNVDAVHINSPIADHAPQSIAALKAGKHVASTVPAATTIDECRQIVEAQRKSGKVYMMMETVVYSREYLFAKELYDQRRARADPVHARQPSAGHGRLAGLLGGLSADALRNALRQPVPGDPRQARRARRLSRLRPYRRRPDPKYGSPFAIETATFKLRDSDVAAEVTRSLFDTARQYRESFDVYGSKKSFEWQQVENEEPVIHTKSTTEKPLTEAQIPERVKVPDYAHLLPGADPAGSRCRRRSRTPSTCRSFRAAATAGRIRTWSTTFCWPASAKSRRCRTPRRRSTGRWSASAPTSRRSRTARRL